MPADLLTNPIITAALGTAIGGIVATIWRRRKEAEDKIDRWYRDSLGIIAQLELAGHRSTTYQQELDPDLLREHVEPLTLKLKEHAGRAPDGVEQNARDELARLAEFSTMIINISEQMEHVGPQQFYSFIQEESKERYSGDYDMDDVNQFISSIDIHDIAGNLDINEDELEVNEKALEEFGQHFSEESIEAGRPTSISEALEMPMDLMNDVVENDEFWTGMMNDSMAEFASIVLIEAAEENYEKMEQRKQAVCPALSSSLILYIRLTNALLYAFRGTR